MFSIDELMGMIATEAIEEFRVGQESSKEYNPDFKELPPFNYDLRLVRHEDGRMEWEE